MIRSALVRLTVGIVGVAVSMTTGSGVGSAGPDDAAVNTHCTYLQMVSAINSHSPDTFARYHSSIGAQTFIKRLITSPPYERPQLLDAMRGVAELVPFVEIMPELVKACKEFPANGGTIPTLADAQAGQ